MWHHIVYAMLMTSSHNTTFYTLLPPGQLDFYQPAVLVQEGLAPEPLRSCPVLILLLIIYGNTYY